MPRPQRTPEEIEEMRQRILQAAHDLVHEGGPGHLTMRRVADRLGVSHMTLYGYFSSRQEMLDALGAMHFARVQARQAEQLARAESGDVLGAIEEELSVYRMLARRRPEMYQLLMTRGFANEDLHCQRMSRFGIHAGFLAQLITLGVEQGRLAARDADQAALVVICMVNGPLLLQAAGYLTDEKLFEEVYDDVIAQALIYLQAT